MQTALNRRSAQLAVCATSDVASRPAVPTFILGCCFFSIAGSSIRW